MKTIILTFNLFFMLSCNNDDESSFQSTEINFTEIGKGSLFGNGVENISQSNLVINNQTDWQSLISQMNSVNNVSDTFSETSIDFNNYIILAVILEIKGNGWEVEISNIVENEANITVTVEEAELINSVINQPYHLVKTPITSKEIVFE